MQTSKLPGQDDRVARLLVTNGALAARIEHLTSALAAVVSELQWFRPGSTAAARAQQLLADEPGALAALTGLQVVEIHTATATPAGTHRFAEAA